MSAAQDAMLEELRRAVPVVTVPDGALTLDDIMAATGLAYNPATKRMRFLVNSGEWKKAKRGVKCYYWKA